MTNSTKLENTDMLDAAKNTDESVITKENLYDIPELPETDSKKENSGPIIINGKRRYFLLSGKLGCWNDVVAEKKKITKRRAKNKVARKTRKLNNKLKKMRKGRNGKKK